MFGKLALINMQYYLIGLWIGMGFKYQDVPISLSYFVETIVTYIRF